MTQYKTYMTQKFSGEHGNTAQFWMQYVKLVQIYLRFSRAYRTNDLDLFTFTLGEMCPIFLPVTHLTMPDRWSNTILTSSTLTILIRPKGNIHKWGSIHQADNKIFLRTAVDTSLEQTINADAAFRLTCISAFT